MASGLEGQLNVNAAIAISVLTALVSLAFFPVKTNADEVEPEIDPNSFLTYQPYEPPATWSSDFKVIKAMWFARITGESLQNRLDSFYETQADLYDSYRFRMLHGRPKMLRAIARHISPSNSGRKTGITWVDLACGTGANVENFATNVKDGKFGKIYLVDLCQPLCQVAKRERAEKYNSKKEIVHVVHGDVTDFNLKGLPEPGTVDLVTISYSLVMIPDWPKALEQAKRLLKPKTGIFAVCDFTVVPDQQAPWSRAFWKRTFEKDHVFLNADHLPTLQANFDELESNYGFGALPYTPAALQAAYYYFVGRNK
mmetsp:Transcript_8519/g.11242  ORF Transcript_8519/g.11242 Transcript_8519/m.11242 type:complete len:312 (+) Transcript_8519:137-1072(+)